MRTHTKILISAAALIAAGLGAAAPATAAQAPPTLITSNFVCSNGVCEVGPGNVGMPFGAGLDGTGGFLALHYHGGDPCGALNSCDLTVTNNLGSSVTVLLPPASY